MLTNNFFIAMFSFTGKNAQFWEVVGSLEKRNKQITVEVNNMKVNVIEIVQDEKEDTVNKDLEIKIKSG